MAEKDNKVEKKTVSEKLAAFLAKYRLLLLGVIGGCIVVAVVLGVILAVTESAHKKALTELDGIVYSLSQKEEADLSAAQDEALLSLEALAEKTKGNIGGIRANMVIAEIH